MKQQSGEKLFNSKSKLLKGKKSGQLVWKSGSMKYKLKEVRETYRQENERLKAEGKQEAEVSASTDIANKYE